MMDAGDLALLDVIIAEGGITAAAARLRQPKTTISRRLRMLEEAVGTQLFERTGRRLRLTRIGEALAAPARDVRAALAAAQALVQANSADDQGALKISAPMLFGHKVLVPLISDFLAARPKVVATLSFEQVPTDPLRHDRDLAFSIQRPEAPYLIVQKLAEIDIRLYGPPSLAALVRAPADLHHLPGIATGSLDVPDVTWTLTDGKKSQPATLRARATVNDPEAAAAFIASGLGIGGLPSFVAEDLVAAGQIVPILPGMVVGTVAIYAATPPLRNRIPIVRSFLSDLREALRSSPLATKTQAAR